MSRGLYRGFFDLSGKTAVVTGGAGILGRRFCSGLADLGAQVAVVDVDKEAASALAEDLKRDYGVRSLAVECDVSSPTAVREMATRVEGELGPIDILHNNAATKSRDPEQFFEPLETFGLDVWREISGVNIDGMFLVAQAVGASMAERGKGSIIQTASIYGVLAPDQRIYEGSEYLGRRINTPPVYSATKAAVVGLTRHLSTYWADRGVRVNALTPGGVESGQNDVFRRNYSARVPLGRMAQPDEMVGALLFLASDASSYVTGQNIVVDGGLSVW